MTDHAFYGAMVEHANELFTVFDRSGLVTYANNASRSLLGYEPAEIVGRRVLEFVHPEDLSRAAEALRIAGTFGTSAGTTHFRLRMKDGAYVPLEMTSATVTGGDRPQLLTISRRADTRFALASVLRLLLEERPARDIIINVCEFFTWRSIGSQVAVAWQRPDGAWDWVGTDGCAAELSGVEMRPGSVWDMAIKTHRDVIVNDPAAMPEDMRAMASRTGRGGYWISPVTDADRPVVISVWIARNGFPPMLHAEGMAMARQFMRLIMQWSDHHDLIARAARIDELTSLPNRRSFFDALSVSAHGAILYCDLDGFKPVNDQHGHGAGDEVLRQVASRLRDTVRAGDTVARIGGDEFAIICPASTAADAEGLAVRIRAAIARPIEIGTVRVHVGISIGIAHTTDRLDAASVAAADRDLYAAKAARRARHAGA